MHVFQLGHVSRIRAARLAQVWLKGVLVYMLVNVNNTNIAQCNPRYSFHQVSDIDICYRDKSWVDVVGFARAYQ